MLVDTRSEDIYKFEVQTSFNYINLKSIEQKLAETKAQNSDLAQVRAKNLLDEYVTTSFMSANEKFNSAMVFETQLDEVGIQSEQKKVNDLRKKKMGQLRVDA